MKRSMAVSLVLLGSTALGMSGCKPKAESYQNVEACEAAGQHSDEECRNAFAAARYEHETTAPHYQTRDECIAAYGPSGCEERQGGGGSFFMPLMLGYMLGGGFGYHPLYQDRNQNGGYVGAGGARFGGYSGGGWFSRFTGGFGGSETSTVSRGGFGSSGSGMSGGE